MSEAVSIDLAIDQGADFGVQIYWTDASNTPFTVTAPMRMDIKADTGQVMHSMVTITNEDEESSILYNSESGLIQLMMSSAETDAIPAGRYDYDLFVTYQDNEVTNETRLKRLLHGKVFVYGRVTKNV
jgi:hypothetical protein